MSNLKGDYQCDECSYTKHDPETLVCPKCGGEMVYMMTDNDFLIIENKKLKKALEKISKFAEEKECHNFKEMLNVAMEMVDIANEALK